LGQPAPLSVNCVNTADALCLVGVITQRQTMTGTKLKMWTLQKIPSARGRCFAQKMLKEATAITATQVRRVPCQRSGVYVASLITTSACTSPPTMKLSTAIIESQEVVASHPAQRQSRRFQALKELLTREVAQQTLSGSRCELRDPMTARIVSIGFPDALAFCQYMRSSRMLVFFLPEPWKPFRQATKR
jgi:hypothetical protein